MKLYGEFQKNQNEVIRGTRREFNGREFLDLRVFFKDAQGEFRPTRKGLAFDEELLDDLIELLQKMKGDSEIYDVEVE